MSFFHNKISLIPTFETVKNVYNVLCPTKESYIAKNVLKRNLNGFFYINIFKNSKLYIKSQKIK